MTKNSVFLMMKFFLPFLILCCGPLFAGVKLPMIFSDGMVLQRDSEAAIWGMAEAGSEVSVHFAGQNISAKALPAGKIRSSPSHGVLGLGLSWTWKPSPRLMRLVIPVKAGD